MPRAEAGDVVGVTEHFENSKQFQFFSIRSDNIECEEVVVLVA
jgi:predicted Fe-Mo cluster-binding NifX family protein